MFDPPGIVPPLLIPPDDAGYEQRSLQKSELLSALDGRAVAQLADIPADLSGDVGLRLSEIKPVDADQIAYSIIASVRYRGSGKTVFVTTSKASPKAAMQQTSLGNKTMQLDDGTLAWQTVGIPGAVSNQIVFAKGDLIVTIAGNVAPDELSTLASKIVISTR